MISNSRFTRGSGLDFALLSRPFSFSSVGHSLKDTRDTLPQPRHGLEWRMQYLRTLGWVVCVVYSTIPLFWLMVHPRAHKWREKEGSPFRVLVPAWITMWIGIGAVTGPWRNAATYAIPWSWIPAVMLFALGIYIYSRAGAHFSLAQLGGLPEVRAGHHDDRLVTTGIRARVRHPVYLGHLCEMLAWSVGTGLIVCWALTAFAIATGAVMIRMEDAELERRFGKAFTEYRLSAGAVLPKWSDRL